MRAVIQRVDQANVTVDGVTVGEIGAGLAVLVGVTHSDTDADARKLADKIAGIRIIDDDDGVMNRSILDAAGDVLVVSQFTLYGETAKGRRPSWSPAAKPEVAEPLIETVVEELRGRGLRVETGRFRADMIVSIVNNGPCTVIVDVPAVAPAQTQ